MARKARSLIQLSRCSLQVLEVAASAYRIYSNSICNYFTFTKFSNCRNFFHKILTIRGQISSFPYRILYYGFYRAMHYTGSAKRGIAIACRLSVRRPSVCPSVRPSVTLVDQDHIGRISWKLIARTLCPRPSLFGAQRSSTYSQGNMGKFWGD